MSTLLSPWLRRVTKPKLIGFVLLVVAFVSAGIVEVLHGHACAGDGCALCLIAACANVLMTVSFGAALACPVARIISQMHMPCGAFRLRLWLASSAFVDVRSERIEMTPVTMGVRASNLMAPLGRGLRSVNLRIEERMVGRKIG